MKMLRRIRIYLVFYENEYNCSEICILLRMQRIRKGIFMLQMLYPDEYLDSTYTIDFKKLYKDGYRGILFDIDNTLVPHGAPADPEAVRLFQKLRDIGFSCCLVSNNRKKRVEPFAASVGAQFIEMAAKPSRKGYERAMERLGTNTGNTVFIGDQLFTDIWGAKNAGLRNILVKPINPKEEIQIVLKSYLEKIVLHFYTKEEKNS